MATENEEKLDVVEVTDELVRTSRYGRRNYRNIIGADNRRHWHGEFVVEEEEVELGEQVVEPEVFGLYADDDDINTEIGSELAEEQEDLVEDTAEEDVVEPDEDVVEDEVQTDTEEAEEEDTDAETTTQLRPEDRGNIADVSYDDQDDVSENPDLDNVDSFFDPLKDVEGLEDVVSTEDQTAEVSSEEDEADAEERTDSVS